MPTITWDHIHLRSPDPEETAQWFAHMLGAEIIRTPQDGKTRIDLKLGGAKIFILPVRDGDGTAPAPQSPYQGLDHFGLFVTELDKMVDELKAKGAEFTKPLHSPRPGIRICFLRGPQGVSVELLERGANFAPA